MSELQKKQLAYLCTLGIAIVLYILAEKIVMWFLYGSTVVLLLLFWLRGLYDTIKGKDPLKFWFFESGKDTNDTND